KAIIYFCSHSWGKWIIAAYFLSEHLTVIILVSFHFVSCFRKFMKRKRTECDKKDVCEHGTVSVIQVDGSGLKIQKFAVGSFVVGDDISSCVGRRIIDS